MRGIARLSTTRGGRISVGSDSDGVSTPRIRPEGLALLRDSFDVCGGATLRRLRPPRRPRRRCFLSLLVKSSEEAGVGAPSAPAATRDSKAVAVSSNGTVGSGIKIAGDPAAASVSAVRREGSSRAGSESGGSSPPIRTTASRAFVFQSPRRNLLAEVRYHCSACAESFAISK